ncbi:MAG: S41 family peptidase [Gemmatirosa sp.]|nr:S41 family peptidase [Gemmatirosa sp.]
MRSTPPLLALALLAAGSASAPALAQPAPDAAAALPASLDDATRRDVVDTMGARLRRHYVDADTGRLIAEHLQGRLRAGAYDTVTSPLRFAELLTTDLQAVNGDRHLYVRYNPANPGQRPGPDGIRMFGPPNGQPNGPARGGPTRGVDDGARRSHYGLGRVDVLPGNVGYLDVRGFAGDPAVEGVMVAALTYLAGTDAVIVDLRRNGGGSAQAVNFLLSHFTTADTVASLTVRNRSGNESFTRYTLPSVPGPRRPDVPLYVLTSGLTASAGEDFAFVLQNLKRATLIGATTAGAGHNNATLDVGHGFGTSISFSRVSDPRTGREWERVGVRPDVAVDQARALDAAHALALGAIAARETDPARRQVLALTKETIEAQAAPRAVPAAMLGTFAGSYDGGRTVSLDDGRLGYSPRPGAPPEPLVALGEATFGMGATRLTFERDGDRVTRLRITLPTGEALTYPRR